MHALPTRSANNREVFPPEASSDPKVCRFINNFIPHSKVPDETEGFLVEVTNLLEKRFSDVLQP